MTDGGRHIPQIRLTREERERYDESVAVALRKAVSEFSDFNGYIDTVDWSLVRKRKQMSVYRSLQPNDDPRVTLMVGSGLIPGTIEEVMDGLYCDNTPDLRAVKTFLKYKFLDGAVLSVTKQRTHEAPFDFTGIKWFAAKAPWGLAMHRDLLTYEVRLSRRRTVRLCILTRYLNLFVCASVVDSAWGQRWMGMETSWRITSCNRSSVLSGQWGP